MILQTAMSYCVVVSRFATESVLRVGGQGRGRLERQESQAETSDAQDAEIHQLQQTRWRGRRLGRPRRLYVDQEGLRRQSARPIAPAGGASRARPKAKASDDEMSLLDGDDDEEEARPRPPPKKRATPAPATKPPRKAKFGSDVEMAEEDRHSRPSQPKKTSAAKARKESDDEDSGDDLVPCALEKGKGKATATQASKRKS
jgi:hypothetical protein